jgi:hypothetical protein
MEFDVTLVLTIFDGFPPVVAGATDEALLIDLVLVAFWC